MICLWGRYLTFLAFVYYIGEQHARDTLPRVIYQRISCYLTYNHSVFCTSHNSSLLHFRSIAMNKHNYCCYRSPLYPNNVKDPRVCVHHHHFYINDNILPYLIAKMTNWRKICRNCNYVLHCFFIIFYKMYIINSLLFLLF